MILRFREEETSRQPFVAKTRDAEPKGPCPSNINL
jgi:hypothetical protein